MAPLVSFNPIPIYVIAMKNSSDRRKTMTERLAALNMEFTFVDAVIGRDLTPAQISAITSPSRQNHLPSPLSHSAIGCGLSHLEIWKKLAAGDAPMALVLEDDAVLSEDIIPILNRLTKLEDKIDIVNLHRRGTRPLIDVAQLSEKYRLTSCRYNSRGTESYVITKKAAAKLAELYLPMEYEVDLFMNRWWDHGLHVLTMNPQLVWEDDTPSTIGYANNKPTWPNDTWRHSLMRRINRGWSSMQKRKLYPSMVATAKMRLMGLDPDDVGNNPEFPNLVKMTADD